MTNPAAVPSSTIKTKVLAAAIFLCVAGSVHSPRVEASGVPVIDAVNQVFNEIVNQARLMARQCFDVRNLQDALKRVQAIQRVSLSTSVNGTTVKLSEAMPQKQPMQGVDEACPSAGGGSVSGTVANSIRGAIGLSTTALNGSTDLRREQMSICKTLVYMRNTKWNKEREVLVKLEEQTAALEKQLAEWNSMVGTGNSSIGDLAKGCGMDSGKGPAEGWQATQNMKAQTFAEESEIEFEKVVAEVEVYQSVINTLEQRQAQVGQMILAGRRPSGFAATAASTLAQGAALKATLSVGNKRCGDKLGVKCP